MTWSKISKSFSEASVHLTEAVRHIHDLEQLLLGYPQQIARHLGSLVETTSSLLGSFQKELRAKQDGQKSPSHRDGD